MTSFDYLLLTLLVLSAILGGMRGLVKEVLSLVNLVFAFWVANRYGGTLVVYLDWAASLSPSMKALLGCAAAFFGSLVVGAIFIRLLTGIVQAAGLSFLDRGLGVLFGFGRGVFIVLLLVVAAGFTSLPQKQFWQESRFAPLAVQTVKEVKPYLPYEVARWVRY
ncbi:MAG: CvpA family protein [Limnobacter sp.]|nr:CvpA family protein [Limnobacter sp.]